MYNLRYSTHALRMLSLFKRSKEIFPPEEAVAIYVDMLEVEEHPISPFTISKDTYEYFFSGRKVYPSPQEYLEYINNWWKKYKPEQIQITISSKKAEDMHKNVSAVAPWLIEKHTILYKFRREYTKRLKKELKKSLAHTENAPKRISIKYTSPIDPYALAENPLDHVYRCSMEETELLEDTQESLQTTKKEEECAAHKKAKEKKQSGLLMFAKKRKIEEKNKVSLRYPGRVYKNQKTIRRSPYIRKPIRMVFIKHHQQIKPPYYHVKKQSPLITRSTTKKILREEEYAYDSDEEWIEGDGESIDEDSYESEEEEEGPNEWIEEDVNEVLFSRGKLPKMDHPACKHFLITEQEALLAHKHTPTTNQ
ncbi:hypothetical protein NEFER03_1227 [Nematocida sp. LUAm3]|nr:hypothetical protein NEFER03_1227 [Nematocida sp. LUAm3]KAI5175836.1 hypothetical protein NEFER02_1705 [Nematocida sp. LUAm2]KAI5178332.1 hypothetical protein NEFER01_1499 [Nematocida sp. LUAm1]